MEFFNKNVQFETFPEGRKIYNMDLDSFEILLDFISIFVHSEMLKNNMNRQDTLLLPPFNAVICLTNKYLVIGITNEKAILLHTIAITLKNESTDENVEENLERTAIGEIGIHIKSYIYINREVLRKFNKFFDDLKNVNGYNDRFNLLRKSKNIEVLIELTKSSRTFIKKIIGGTNSILKINPIFKARNLSIDNKLCFCILPFEKRLMELFDEVIKPNLEGKKNFDLTVVKADNIFSSNDIMEDIWTYICKSRFVIADVTGKNPNVFYELGICHTLGKEVIIICDEDSFVHDYDKKLPFDIQSRRTIFYEYSGAGPTRMVDKLKKHVQSVLSGSDVVD